MTRHRTQEDSAKPYIAYYRLSRQGRNAGYLGIEAQREAVARFVGDGQLVAEFTEIESGRRHNNRPQLLAALEQCRKRRATLVIAKLDRLGRNVAFISALMESGADFVCCDNPGASPLLLHVLAAFAQHEREQISERTKAALAAAKARGTKLGNPRAAEAAAIARAAKGNLTPAPEVRNLIAHLAAEGKGLRAIARELNRLNVRTPRGYQWYAETIQTQFAISSLPQRSPGATVAARAAPALL
jgi:DNA invertase Pin-like site-specific DNA recombinase